jgi:hypothetical protein
MDLLDQVIAAHVEKQSADGIQYTEAEVAQLREEAIAAGDSEQVADLVESVANGEVAEEFQRMNFTIGLPGALALFESVLRGSGMSNKRVKLHMRNLRMPEDCKISMRGGLTIALPGDRGEYHLHGGECDSNHDFGAEMDKVSPHLSEADLERVQNQCAHVVLFTRQAYVTLAKLNELIVQEAVAGLGPVKITESIDVANSSIYLQKTEEDGTETPFKPRAGLFFTKK